MSNETFESTLPLQCGTQAKKPWKHEGLAPLMRNHCNASGRHCFVRHTVRSFPNRWDSPARCGAGRSFSAVGLGDARGSRVRSARLLLLIALRKPNMWSRVLISWSPLLSITNQPGRPVRARLMRPASGGKVSSFRRGVVHLRRRLRPRRLIPEKTKRRHSCLSKAASKPQLTDVTAHWNASQHQSRYSIPWRQLCSFAVGGRVWLVPVCNEKH